MSESPRRMAATDPRLDYRNFQGPRSVFSTAPAYNLPKQMSDKMAATDPRLRRPRSLMGAPGSSGPAVGLPPRTRDKEMAIALSKLTTVALPVATDMHMVSSYGSKFYDVNPSNTPEYQPPTQAKPVEPLYPAPMVNPYLTPAVQVPPVAYQAPSGRPGHAPPTHYRPDARPREEFVLVCDKSHEAVRRFGNPVTLRIPKSYISNYDYSVTKVDPGDRGICYRNKDRNRWCLNGQNCMFVHLYPHRNRYLYSLVV